MPLVGDQTAAFSDGYARVIIQIEVINYYFYNLQTREPKLSLQ